MFFSLLCVTAEMKYLLSTVRLRSRMEHFSELASVYFLERKTEEPVS